MRGFITYRFSWLYRMIFLTVGEKTSLLSDLPRDEIPYRGEWTVYRLDGFGGMRDGPLDETALWKYPRQRSMVCTCNRLQCGGFCPTTGSLLKTSLLSAGFSYLSRACCNEHVMCCLWVGSDDWTEAFYIYIPEPVASEIETPDFNAMCLWNVMVFSTSLLSMY